MRKHPAGEPYAGEPHVRFGGRGGLLPDPYHGSVRLQAIGGTAAAGDSRLALRLGGFGFDRAAPSRRRAAEVRALPRLSFYPEVVNRYWPIGLTVRSQRTNREGDPSIQINPVIQWPVPGVDELLVPDIGTVPSGCLSVPQLAEMARKLPGVELVDFDRHGNLHDLNSILSNVQSARGLQDAKECSGA